MKRLVLLSLVGIGLVLLMSSCFVTGTESTSLPELLQKYFENSKLVLKGKIGARFDFDAIVKDPALNAKRIPEGVYWDKVLKWWGDEYHGFVNFPKLKIRMLLTEEGDIYVGPISGSDIDQLKVLAFGWMFNYFDFKGKSLPPSVYKEPHNHYLDEDTIRQNLLGLLMHWEYGDWKSYKYLYNKGYVLSGPSNTNEFYHNEFTLYNLFDEKITVVRFYLFHQQFDYSWYPQNLRPVEEAMNSKWSPIANNPDQNAEIGRYADIYYPARPEKTIVYIFAGSDNGMYNRTTVYGIESVEDWSTDGGDSYRHWYVEYDREGKAYTVRNKNCAYADLILESQYPTRVEMEGFTTWSSFANSFVLVALGGDVGWKNVMEKPYPGDDGNPEPMKIILQPGANTVR